MVTPLAAHLRWMPVEHNTSLNISSFQRRTSLFVAGATVPKVFSTTDVPAPFLDHNDNRCYADAPLSSRLYHWAFQCVRHTFYSPSFPLLL